MNWLRERLKVVDESIRVAKASMRMVNGVVAGGANADELQRVIIDLNIERAKMNIELHVLSKLVI
jgi:hypothetical protein